MLRFFIPLFSGPARRFGDVALLLPSSAVRSAMETPELLPSKLGLWSPFSEPLPTTYAVWGDSHFSVGFPFMSARLPGFNV